MYGLPHYNESKFENGVLKIFWSYRRAFARCVNSGGVSATHSASWYNESTYYMILPLPACRTGQVDVTVLSGLEECDKNIEVHGAAANCRYVGLHEVLPPLKMTTLTQEVLSRPSYDIKKSIEALCPREFDDFSGWWSDDGSWRATKFAGNNTI